MNQINTLRRRQGAMGRIVIELHNFNLNLLVAFELLMEEKNVSRAAERMFVTQSAMSHTLQRLRQQLDDPLLVKTPARMKPTGAPGIDIHVKRTKSPFPEADLEQISM